MDGTRSLEGSRLENEEERRTTGGRGNGRHRDSDCESKETFA